MHAWLLCVLFSIVVQAIENSYQYQYTVWSSGRNKQHGHENFYLQLNELS